MSFLRTFLIAICCIFLNENIYASEYSKKIMNEFFWCSSDSDDNFSKAFSIPYAVKNYKGKCRSSFHVKRNQKEIEQFFKKNKSKICFNTENEINEYNFEYFLIRNKLKINCEDKNNNNLFEKISQMWALILQEDNKLKSIYMTNVQVGKSKKAQNYHSKINSNSQNSINQINKFSNSEVNSKTKKTISLKLAKELDQERAKRLAEQRKRKSLEQKLASLEKEKQKRVEEERKRKELEKKLDALQSKKKKQIKQKSSNGMGSGFYVSKFRHIITNQHVVNKCNKITVGNSISKQIPASLVASDKRNDLAILQTISMDLASADTKSFVQNLSIEIVPIVSGGLMRSEDVKGGEEIMVAGYPLGDLVSDTIKVTKGIVSATRGMDNNFSQFEIDAVIRKGNSGGPIYDKQGNIVGVAVSRLSVNRTDTINFGIKGSTVKQFLSANDVPTTWANRAQKIDTQDLYKIASKQTVMVVCHR